MTDHKNRSVLGTFTWQTIACARKAILQARELEVPEMEEGVLAFMMDTAGIDGRAREDLRDALMGARPMIQPVAVGGSREGERNGMERVPHL